MKTTRTNIMNTDTKEAFCTYLLRMADDRLVLGHRLSEWCGHGPILEEDIAMANIALDYIGHASSLLKYAGEIEDQGRDEDQLAYFRSGREYLNIKMVELPKGDFGFTIARQLLFSTFSLLYYQQLMNSNDEQLKGLAAKAFKESRYHFRHSKEWTLRLGDGTDESHGRIQHAFDELWMYTEELFYMDDIDRKLMEEDIAVDLTSIKPEWEQRINYILTEATLTVPSDDQYMQSGGRNGIHTEYLGYLLGEMQILPRTYPDAQW